MLLRHLDGSGVNSKSTAASQIYKNATTRLFALTTVIQGTPRSETSIFPIVRIYRNNSKFVRSEAKKRESSIRGSDF
jgi:hypothetical protein